jgi:LysM repeat protein
MAPPVRRRRVAPGKVPNPYAPKYTWAPWGTTGVVHDNCYDYAFGSFSPVRQSKSVPGNRSGISSNGLNFRSCAGIAKRVLADNPGNVYLMKNPNARPKPGFYKVMCFVAPSNDFGNSTGDFHWYKEISAVQYKIRAGDTVLGLARFFRVTPRVVLTALAKGRSSANANNGRIANKNTDLHVLGKYNIMALQKSQRATRQKDTLRVLQRYNAQSNNSRLMPGRVIEIPVKLWSHKTGWAGGPLLVDASGKTISDPRKANRSYKPGFQYTKFCSAYGVRRGFAKTGTNSNRGAGPTNSRVGMVNRVL